MISGMTRRILTFKLVPFKAIFSLLFKTLVYDYYGYLKIGKLV